MTGRMAVAAGLIVAAAALSGCFESFRPSQPQPLPGSGRGGANVALRYDSPETTLATIQAAVDAKGSGNAKGAYLGAFANPATHGMDFTTIFDPLVVERQHAAHHDVPTWTYGLESNFYSDFVLLRSTAYGMRWTAHPTAGNDVRNSDDATLHRRYQVFLIDDAGNTLGLIAAGLADLSFRKVDGQWVIVRWEDHLDPDADPSNPDEISMGERRLGL